jgi:nitrite reductase (NO-forming)
MKTLPSLVLCSLAAAAAAAPDAATMDRGKAVYSRTCIACHQPTGMGLPPVFPPLAGSEWIAKSASIAVRNIINGMQGPITVKGVTYNSMMPPVAGLSDKDIADVVTYVNNSFGNSGAAVTEAEVKAIKEKYKDRKTPWTAAEYEKEPKEEPAKK